MPIDPNIYGSIRPVAPADPMQTLAQISAMQNMQQQRAEAQQRIQINQAAEERLSQSAALEDQKRKEALELQQTLRSAFQNSTTPEGQIDIPKVSKYLIDNGHGDAVPGIQEKLLQAQQAIATYQESAGKNEKAARDAIGGIAAGVLQMPKEQQIVGVQNGLAWLQGFNVLSPQQTTTIINQIRDAPENLDTILNVAVKQSPEQQGLINAAPKPQIVGPQGGTVLNPDQTTTVIPPSVEQQPTAAGLAVKAANGDPHAAAALRLLHPPAGSGGTGGYSQDDVKLTVQGMKNGSLPPLLPGRASPSYNAIMAEAQRQGFDLSRAATDWVATQTHVKTLNNAQQTRLNQSINALPDILDTVQALADKWNGGQYPLLNRANLAAAKNGVYGPEVASVATQLEAQIADAAADLGNVYMGGNSPTDYALRLAQTSLSGSWDRKVLTDMVKLAKQNVQVRRNSINNTGVQGASADNLYAPPSPGVQPPPVVPPPANTNTRTPAFKDAFSPK